MKVTKNNVALPLALLDYVVNMTEKDTDELRVLVYILSKEGELDTAEISEALSIEESEVMSAVSFWRGMGIVGISGRAKGKSVSARCEKTDADKTQGDFSENVPVTLPNSIRDTDTRTYTGEEIAKILKKSDANSLHDFAQRRLGKSFSHSDTESLVRLLDYVLLTPEMVMLIIEHCVENGKNSMRYVEKTAISIFDEGIRDYDSLVTYFEKKRAAKTGEGIVKRILGISERNFTVREKEHISKWFNEFSYGEEMISLAYERTIANIAKPSVPYMSKLLELWHGKGFKNVVDVENERNLSQKDEGSKINLDSFDEASKKVRDTKMSACLDLEDFFENP